jgi:hypothetical protein
MPLFYFDIDDGEFAADPCGEDLPDLDAARSKALEACDWRDPIHPRGLHQSVLVAGRHGRHGDPGPGNLDDRPAWSFPDFRNALERRPGDRTV